MPDPSAPIPMASHAPPATLPYSRPKRPPRAPLWRVAPRRCAWLGAAWVLALGSLLLPGCQDSSSSGGGQAPTYMSYSFSISYAVMYASGARDGSTQPSGWIDLNGALPAAACALYPVGSVVFFFTPLLLWRRVFFRFGAWAWATCALLWSPWVLLAVFAAAGAGGNFLYGFYLLALAHTLAFAVIAWPPPAPQTGGSVPYNTISNGGGYTTRPTTPDSAPGTSSSAIHAGPEKGPASGSASLAEKPNRG